MTVFAQIAPIEPGVSHDLAIWRAARYSDIRYKLNLTLEKMSPVLKGTLEIRVDIGARTLMSASPQGGEIAPIILDWRKIKGSESLSTISTVSINGVSVLPEEPAMRTGVSALHFEESNEHLIFRDGVKAGENVIKLDFTSPILTSGAAVTRYVDKEDGGEYIYSLFVPSDASTAFPVFDQPDLKARFKLTVGVPVRDDGLNWHVISNTPGERSREGGLYDLHDSRHMDDKAYIFTAFAETKPISTYVFAFAAGDFAEFSDDKSVPPAVAGGLTREPKKVSGNPSLSNADRQPPATAGGTDKKALSDKTSEPLTRVYVRRSQAKKFEKEAPEVFRLT
ncbi:MAG TPA: hypothetical protein VL327_07880, partial [Pyrinomonadaceae bacterium]|nr:hypothetical protein [Pyrinomonadaceae bacterium]